VLYFLVVEITIVATAQIRLAMGADILPLNLFPYLYAFSAFPTFHKIFLPF
jgi:hypothetical protein